MDEDNYYEHIGFGDFHRLYVCRRDGIAVADKDKHDQWHREQAYAADDARWGGMSRPLGL